MGGRDLPVVCPHGLVVDWGGYGRLPERCARCEAAEKDTHPQV